MSDQWDIRITGPNGAQGHLIADDGDEQALTEQFVDFVKSVKKAASVQIGNQRVQPVDVALRKTPRGGKR